MDEICIAGKKYDVKNSDKRLEVAIPAKVSEDLRMWSEYVYENHAVENGMPVPLLRNGYSIFNGTKYR